MTVYHGVTLEIRHPDAGHSKRFLDFGPAFYVTSFRDQAERWARRKSSRSRNPVVPVVNVYELDDAFQSFSVLRFDGVDDIPLERAIDVYYRSRLARQIAEGLYGIENLDYKYLVDDLIENEPELLGQGEEVK